MKKVLLAILTLLMVNSAVFAFPFFKKDTTLTTVPLLSTKTKAENTVWVGTFQLVWNDLMNDIVRGEVFLEGGNDDVADGLNQQNFRSTMISEDSYYKIHGVTTTTLRDTINAALMQKFNETSNLLSMVDWNGRDYLLYAMLKKDFQFPYVYDELTPAKFANSKENVKYFGIDEKSDEGLRGTVDVLFYNSKNDYAVILNTKDKKDLVLLYRTNDKLTLAEAYKQMLESSFEYEGDKTFKKSDKLKVPFIKFKNDYTYKNLTNKKIKGTDFTIGTAMQTVDFNLDKKGVKLKSEAAMIMRMSMVIPEKEETREFNFDDNFYLFLQENMNAPYFAMKVGDVKGINKQ